MKIAFGHAALALGLAFAAMDAAAWGSDGHSIIGEIAQRPTPVLVVCHGMAIRLVLAALGRPVAAIANAALVDCSGAASSSGRAPDF